MVWIVIALSLPFIAAAILFTAKCTPVTDITQNKCLTKYRDTLLVSIQAFFQNGKMFV